MSYFPLCIPSSSVRNDLVIWSFGYLNGPGDGDGDGDGDGNNKPPEGGLIVYLL